MGYVEARTDGMIGVVWIGMGWVYITSPFFQDTRARNGHQAICAQSSPNPGFLGFLGLVLTIVVVHLPRKPRNPCYSNKSRQNLKSVQPAANNII